MFLPLRAEVPRLRFPTATVLLCLACMAVYAYEQALGSWQIVHFARMAGVVPWEISHLTDLVDEIQPRDVVAPPFTIITSMFVHGDLVHLFGNLWFLWLFGSRLEPLVGAARFVGCYLACGTVAALLQVWAAPQSTMPMIGASGAIAGVLGAYAYHFPKEPIRSLAFVSAFATSVRLPSWLLLGMWLLGQVLSAEGHTAGVAWYAHIGGFLCGLGLAKLFVAPPLGLPFAYRDGYDAVRGGALAQAGGGGPLAGSLGAGPPVPAP